MLAIRSRRFVWTPSASGSPLEPALDHVVDDAFDDLEAVRRQQREHLHLVAEATRLPMETRIGTVKPRDRRFRHAALGQCLEDRGPELGGRRDKLRQHEAGHFLDLYRSAHICTQGERWERV
jgi:hypothetical protein